jgi:hypothetical protein
VGPGECLDVLGKRRISFPRWDSNPVLSEPYPSHCIDEGGIVKKKKKKKKSVHGHDLSALRVYSNVSHCIETK